MHQLRLPPLQTSSSVAAPGMSAPPAPVPRSPPPCSTRPTSIPDDGSCTALGSVTIIVRSLPLGFPVGVLGGVDLVAERLADGPRLVVPVVEVVVGDLRGDVHRGDRE